jgi:exopolysaccharide biosynthesis WecB/TagA/CpsF family protein
MGFIGDDREVQRVVEFVNDHPARFVFLAVGSPRQEIVALRVRQHGGACGIGLCIGNSLNFLAYPESRAPAWIGRLHLEWLHRLMTDPARLWRRYLLDNPAIFGIFLRAALTRTAIGPMAAMGGEGLSVRQPGRP